MKFNHENHPLNRVNFPINSQTQRNTLIFPEKRTNSALNAQKMKRIYCHPSPPSFCQNYDPQFPSQHTRGVLLQPQTQFRQFNQRFSQKFEHLPFSKPLQGYYLIFDMNIFSEY